MWQPEGRINNMILKGNKRTSLCGPIFNFKMIKEYQFCKTEGNKRSAKKYKKGIKMSTVDEQEWCYTQWQIMKLQ